MNAFFQIFVAAFSVLVFSEMLIIKHDANSSKTRIFSNVLKYPLIIIFSFLDIRMIRINMHFMR